MSKDPAFLLYSKDWITGTQFMSMEERGIYLTLVLAQHQNGHLDTKRVGFILGLSWDMVPVIVKEKFLTDEAGLIYNERLDIEVEKRATYLSKQKENGAKGGRPPKPKNNPTVNPNPNPNKTMHVANVNDNVDLNEDNEKGGMGEKKKVPYSETFNLKWEWWESHTKKVHGTVFTTDTREMALKELFIWAKTESRAIEMIEYAVAKNWKHINPDKQIQNGNNRQHANGTGNGAPGPVSKIRDGDRKDFER